MSKRLTTIYQSDIIRVQRLREGEPQRRKNKMKISEKKKELTSHIMWKLRSETEEKRAETLKYIRKLSWQNLKEYAIMNDFIDVR